MKTDKENSNASLAYTETQSALEVRIQAHQKYSNFSLEDWIDRELPLSPGVSLLDIGCGNGNLFPSYSKKMGEHGVIVGLDQSQELLQKASRRETPTPKVLLQWDMNQALPFIEESFDVVVSSFAIYYVDDVMRITKDIQRTLRKTGSLFLIGPTDRNAAELYTFNEKVFGFPRDEKVNARTNRLENEFYPALQKVFGSVKSERIPSKLVFPGQEEFLRYYCATLLFEESSNKAGYIPDINALAKIEMPAWEISKEMVVLCGRQ